MVMALALGRKTLSFHSALTAAMITVECSATLAMTLSQKESLAARFYIFQTSLVSLISIVSVFLFMSSIHQYDQGTECCARVIWWGIIDYKSISPTFWLYLAYRGWCWIRNILICLMLTGPFDKAGRRDHESHASTDSDNDSEKGKSEKTKNLRLEYTDMPATVDLHYLDWMFNCLSSLISLETMLRRFGLPKDEGLDKWGQAMQRVLCIAGVLHLCFNVYKHCKHGWQRPKLLHAVWELHHVSFWWNYEEIVREIDLEWRLPAVEGGGLLSRFKARAATMLQHTLDRGDPTSAAHHSKHRRSEADEDDGHEQYQGAAGTSTGVSGAHQGHHGLQCRSTRITRVASQAVHEREVELINAAESGPEATVRGLLEENIDTEARNWYDNIALLCAARSGREDIVKLLLGRKADIEAKNNKEETALMIAAEIGYTGLVKLLIAEGANKEYTPAMKRQRVIVSAVEKGTLLM